MPASQNLNHQIKYNVPMMRLCLVHEGRTPQQTLEIVTPDDAAKLLRPLKLASEEKFVSLHLNARNHVVGLHEVSHGTLSTIIPA